MRNGPENPIALGEHFLIRDAEIPKPITANVIEVRWSIEEVDGVWQRAVLRRLGRPMTSFELTTSKRMQYGAYTNRDGRYTFLRLAVLPFEELVKYFDNGNRQLAEEFIKNGPR